jgi:hypothetical protein
MNQAGVSIEQLPERFLITSCGSCEQDLVARILSSIP